MPMKTSNSVLFEDRIEILIIIVRRKVLQEKLKIFPTSYETRMLITVSQQFTTVAYPVTVE